MTHTLVCQGQSLVRYDTPAPEIPGPPIENLLEKEGGEFWGDSLCADEGARTYTAHVA